MGTLGLSRTSARNACSSIIALAIRRRCSSSSRWILAATSYLSSSITPYTYAAYIYSDQNNDFFSAGTFTSPTSFMSAALLEMRAGTEDSAFGADLLLELRGDLLLELRGDLLLELRGDLLLELRGVLVGIMHLHPVLNEI